MLQQLAWRQPFITGRAAWWRQHSYGGDGWHGMATRAQPDAAVHRSGYTTLAQAVTATTEVKKSKFITTAWPVQSASEAMQLIQETELKDASHNCWAYVIGNEFRSSDDGEPSGTAGRPILAAIQGEGLDGTCVLVTRYFGGTKLGPGGLVRAYGGATRDCLRAAPKEFRPARVSLDLQLPYRLMGVVYGQVERFGATRAGEEQYQADGSVLVTVTLDADREQDFITAVSELTAGGVLPRQSGGTAG